MEQNFYKDFVFLVYKGAAIRGRRRALFVV